MLVFSDIMTFMWQYYVTKDTKLLRQYKHSFNGLCSPSGIIQTNQKKTKKTVIIVTVSRIKIQFRRTTKCKSYNINFGVGTYN